MAQPDWLRERVNDCYGTPNKHAFWETVTCEIIGNYRVFQRDAKWYAYDRQYNAWYGFADLASVMAHVSKGSVDIWA